MHGGLSRVLAPPHARMPIDPLGRDCDSLGPLASFNFAAMAPGAIALDPRLSFSRASGPRSVRTGSATLASSAGALYLAPGDQPVAEWSAGGNGLSLWGSSTNLVPLSRAMSGTGWTAGLGNTATTGQTSPDGTTNATRQQIAADVGGNNHFSSYNNLGSLNGQTVTASMWAKDGGSGPTIHSNFYTGSQNTPVSFSITSQWNRYATTFTAGTLQLAIWCDSRANAPLSAIAQDAILDAFQVESRTCATPYIPTTGTTATRAGERLYTPSASNFVRGGRLVQRVTFVAPSSSNAMNADAYLAHYDASNNVCLSKATRQLTITLNGAAWTAPGVCNWLAGDTVTIEHGSGGGQASFAMLTVGGYTAPLGLTATAQANWPTASALNICCAGTTGQLESSAIKLVEFW